MNVFEKLNLARIKMQQRGLKQTGKNGKMGNTFFELEVILPESNSICAEIKALAYVTFSSDTATLYFVDCEKPEDRIIFTSPMSTAKLAACHEVQNLGAVETYLKRYLYQNLYELSEKESLDNTFGLTEEEKHLEDLITLNAEVLGKGKADSPYELARNCLIDGRDIPAMIKRVEEYLNKKRAAVT